MYHLAVLKVRSLTRISLGQHQGGCSCLLFWRLLGRIFSHFCQLLEATTSLGLWPLPLSSKPEMSHLLLTDLTGKVSPFLRTHAIRLGPPGESRLISQLKILNLTTSAKSLTPHKVVYSQILAWMSLGAMILSPTGVGTDIGVLMPKTTPDFMVDVLENCWSHLRCPGCHSPRGWPTLSFLGPGWD